MQDDTAQSSYLTLKEAAEQNGFSYNTLYTYVVAGRVKSKVLAPHAIPQVLWNRLDTYARANVYKHNGLRVTTQQDIDTYLASRHQGRHTDLL